MSDDRKIEVVNGNGDDLEISPVYDHLDIEKPNTEKKKEIVWLLEKCIGSIGVFCLCSPLLLVQSKVFLQCLGAGLFIVWHELLLYCVKSMGDKRILQRELPFFLLLSWKYSLEERNKSDYLAASQMVV